MRRSLGIFALALLIAVPLTTFAQTASTRATFFGPIVPLACHCDNQTVQGTSQQVSTAPDYGCVLQTLQNLINFAVSIGILFVVFWIAVAGFQLIVSRGNPAAITQARARITNAVLGIVVILAAWLIVDFVMKTLYNQNSVYGPWNAILAGGNQCIVAKNPAVISVQTVANNITSVTPGTTAGASGQINTTSGTSKLNTSSADSFATNNALSSSSGKCALYVREALSAGGLTQFDSNHPASAYQYGPYLTNAGFAASYTGTYSSASEQLGNAQAGDVVVFQPVPGHPDGHIAIYNGSEWVSDYKQNTMSSNPSAYIGGTFTIYHP